MQLCNFYRLEIEAKFPQARKELEPELATPTGQPPVETSSCKTAVTTLARKAGGDGR